MGFDVCLAVPAERPVREVDMKSRMKNRLPENRGLFPLRDAVRRDQRRADSGSRHIVRRLLIPAGDVVEVAGVLPFFAENFEEIVKLCREYSIVPNFTTSGILMTKEKAEICKKYCGAVAVSEHFSDYTDKALEEIENIRNSIRDVTEFVSTIAKIRDKVALVLGTPADFADRIQNLLTMTKDVLSVGFANDAVKESLDIIDSLVAAKRDSADLVANDLNGDIDRLQLMSAAAMAARSVVDSSIKSAEEAREMQDKVAATFTAAADVAESVDDYADLMDLQAAALKYLRDEMSKLAVIVELPMSYSRDILSVCFDCYGDLDRVDDILERNGIGDPLVITARNVRVLSK